MADANKTEPGTAHRREEARKEGQLARSRDLPGAVAMLAAIAVLAWFSGGAVAQWGRLLAGMLDSAARPDAVIGLAQFQSTLLLTGMWCAAVGGAAWICCSAVAFQGGFVVAPMALLKFERLQPGQNIKNMFSASSLSRTARSIVPVAFMAWFTWGVLAASWGQLVRSTDMTVAQALAWLMQMALALAWRGGAVLLAWAGVDYMLQRRTHEQSLKMTKQEVKEDTKQTQGSPETRGRIRRIQRQIARRRMMQAIPSATVVITNPTEFAVALHYDPRFMAAPVVVAKGHLLLAQRIRALAVQSGVPVIENRAVARALYAHVEIGMPIPGQLYQAVAEILAFLRRAEARRTAQA